MFNEFSALVHQGTWEPIPPTLNQHLIGCKWVFKLKWTKNGSIKHYKMCLVAKNFHQQLGFDYFNNFNPIIKSITIQTFLSITISHKWLIH